MKANCCWLWYQEHPSLWIIFNVTVPVTPSRSFHSNSLIQNLVLFPLWRANIKFSNWRRKKHHFLLLKGVENYRLQVPIYNQSRRLFHRVDILIKTPHYLQSPLSFTPIHSTAISWVSVQDYPTVYLLWLNYQELENEQPYYLLLSQMILGVDGHRPQGHKIMYINSHNV